MLLGCYRLTMAVASDPSGVAVPFGENPARRDGGRLILRTPFLGPAKFLGILGPEGRPFGAVALYVGVGCFALVW